MIRQKVFSSRISSIGWDNNILEVEFKNGSLYQYFNVTRIEYLNFINSPSLGKALSFIDKTHPYHRV